MHDSTMVFHDEVHGRPEVVVNFGVFAGREVTQAEIDRLAQQLLAELESFEIVSEQRHQIDRSLETSVHQVRIAGAEGRRLDEALVEQIEAWAKDCIAERNLLGS
ncbi:MAG: hypothetical protein ACR2L0_00180 [Gaiellaceae bacterium]